MLTNIHTLKNIIILITVIITFQACEKDELMMATKEYPGVAVELWIHFENFEIAAAERGVNIDLIEKGITGSLESINMENTIAASCTHRMDAPNHVTMDEGFWTRSNSDFFKRELIVFHELGHCYMNLEHRDEVDGDGHCESIMRSGLSNCIDLYTADTRGAYLDELFSY